MPEPARTSDAVKGAAADPAALSGGGLLGMPLLSRIAGVRELSLVAVLVLLAVVVTPQNSTFLTRSNLEQIGLSVALIGIVSIGQTLVVVARQIDLSVGSMLGFTGFIAESWLKQHHGGGLVAVFLIGAGLGLGLGLVNGLLVAIGEIPAIVVTLGTLSIYRGAILLIANGQEVSASDVPQSFLNIGTARWIGIPSLIWIALAITVGFAVLLRYTRLGRNLYAMGGNAEAARLAGIKTRPLTIGVFCVSGLLCGIVGVLWGARYGTFDPTIGTGLELQTVAAVAIGGVSIFGGSGTVVGGMLGALLLGSIANAFQLLRINQFWLDAVTGLFILASVAIYTLLNRRTRLQLNRRRAAAAVEIDLTLEAVSGGRQP